MDKFSTKFSLTLVAPESFPVLFDSGFSFKIAKAKFQIVLESFVDFFCRFVDT